MINDTDIENLNEKELIHLNHRIVDRLKYLSTMKNAQALQYFHVGEEVSFDGHEPKEIVIGNIIRLNTKTATIRSNDGVMWRVNPRFISKVIHSDVNEVTILPFRKTS